MMQLDRTAALAAPLLQLAPRRKATVENVHATGSLRTLSRTRFRRAQDIRTAFTRLTQGAEAAIEDP
jgi:hypothetical protein